MDTEGWETSTDFRDLLLKDHNIYPLEITREDWSSRKRYLLGCSLMRNIPYLPLSNSGVIATFKLIEDYADRIEPAKALDQARNTAEHINKKHDKRYMHSDQWASAVNKLISTVWRITRVSFDGPSPSVNDLLWIAIHTADGPQRCNILRHHFRNPYCIPIQSKFSQATVQLAQSVYEQKDCKFALHDSLLEEGKDLLASHVINNQCPKGCWVLDLILGKE